MNLIAVSGRIGSGKTTFSELLKKELEKAGKEVELINFADKLKRICHELTGYYGYTQEEKNIYLDIWGDTVGGILQKIGTKAMRENFDQDVWVKSTLSGLNDSTYYIIGDCRFENEGFAIKKIGGIIIRLNGDPAEIRKLSKRDLSHSSETALDNYNEFDYIYKNNKSLGDLENFAKEIVLNLFEKKNAGSFNK